MRHIIVFDALRFMRILQCMRVWNLRFVVGVFLVGSWVPGDGRTEDSKPADAAKCASVLIPKVRKNSLMRPSFLPHEALPFDEITFDQFKPAFGRGFRLAKVRLEAIRKDASEPTFENTIEALETVDEPLDQVKNVFSNYLGLKKTPELEKLAETIKPRLSKFENSIIFDAHIFARVEKLYQKRQTLGLTVEEMTLLENRYLSFVRNGAKLTAAEKARVDEIDQRLTIIAEAFESSVTREVDQYELLVTDPKELAGLPEGAVHAAREAAEKKGKEKGWIFTLVASSVISVLDYADNRELREKLWRAYSARATSGKNDNRPLAIEIALLRQERARLLGYKSHAHYTTEDRMAENPEKVSDFLTRLAEVYRPAAMKELEELKQLAGHELQPWDMAYYSAKLRQKLYSYDNEELRPYFELDKVIDGAMKVAGRLYGVTFKPRKDLPTWDESVRAYEVFDRDGKFLSLFYLDPFPRPGAKRGGAWMSSFRDSGLFDGQMRRPHVINVGNFTAPLKGKPALLTADEVTTVFHELGHGLHGMLSRVQHRSLSGTNVAWDFVELPSMINENWAFQPEVLDLYAFHHETGQRIPAELVAKLQKAKNFQVGLSGLRQVGLGMLDFAWHAHDVDPGMKPEDVEAFEARALGPYRVLKVPAGAMTSPAFTHIFAGGYSAGYYSYKWSELLAADGFSVFKKEGIFSLAVADRFRGEILERGGTEKPAILYRKFRGGDPDPDALLRDEGLLH